jgi:hypothetical protein
MAGFTRWTNLSEATFVLPPTRPNADYRVRIFTRLSDSRTHDWDERAAVRGTPHAGRSAARTLSQASSGFVLTMPCRAGQHAQVITRARMREFPRRDGARRDVLVRR